MRDGEPRHNDDSRGLGPYSTSIKKAEKEKEIKEMAKKINDLCEMGAIFLWVYVYNIVRISVEAGSIDVKDSSICKYTSETTAVKPESITEVFRIQLTHNTN
ncbi:26S proteasome regulatory subunit 7A [Orobanche gracilis]